MEDGPGLASSTEGNALCSSSSPQGGGSPTASAPTEKGVSNASQQLASVMGNPEGGLAESSAQPRTAAQLGFRITGEDERYSRYWTLYDRTIRFPAHGSHPVGALPTSQA